MKVAYVIRHILFEDLGLLEPLLQEQGYEIRVLEPEQGRLRLDDEVGGDLLIVLGGPIGVMDVEKYPFLLDEIEYLAKWISQEKPVLGICLGAQLIAASLGATVGATGRREIGFSELELTPSGNASVLRPLAGVPVLHWHGDAFEIPRGADRLAETPGFPNQAFAFGERVLGLQFHIEADSTRIERWLIGHAVELHAAGIDPRTIRSDAMQYGPQLKTAATDVLRSWLDSLD